jgi:serine/threonine-protein phosphatase 6 regulatory ankyrin repeat subunit B
MMLLRRGADVDVLNKANKTAAELASENGHAEVAKIIAEYKADGNIRDNIYSTTLDTAQYGADDDGMDEGATSLHSATKEGDTDVVESLLEGGININCRNASSGTPLGTAAADGKVDIVRLLIERGAEVDSHDMWGWTPLHEASKYGHLEVSQLLIDHGANVNARELDHRTPLSLSARNGHLGVVKLLLERGADVHAQNEDGQTPYQLSLRSGYRATAEFLREHGGGRERFENIFLSLRCYSISDSYFHSSP